MLAKEIMKDRREITSLYLAEYLNKRHDHVLRDIKIEKERWLPIKDGIRDFFIESEYLSKGKQLRPMFKLTLEAVEIMLYKYRSKTLPLTVKSKKYKKI